MNMQQITDFLMWSTIINMAMLLFSFIMLMVAKDFVYKIHSKFLPMSHEYFNAMLYMVFGFYKMTIIIFFFVPWIVMKIIA